MPRFCSQGKEMVTGLLPPRRLFAGSRHPKVLAAPCCPTPAGQEPLRDRPYHARRPARERHNKLGRQAHAIRRLEGQLCALLSTQVRGPGDEKDGRLRGFQPGLHHYCRRQDAHPLPHVCGAPAARPLRQRDGAALQGGGRHTGVIPYGTDDLGAVFSEGESAEAGAVSSCLSARCLMVQGPLPTLFSQPAAPAPHTECKARTVRNGSSAAFPSKAEQALPESTSSSGVLCDTV